MQDFKYKHVFKCKLIQRIKISQELVNVSKLFVKLELD